MSHSAVRGVAWGEKAGWQSMGHGKTSLVSALAAAEASLGVLSPPSQRAAVLDILSDPVSLWEALVVIES